MAKTAPAEEKTLRKFARLDGDVVAEIIEERENIEEEWHPDFLANHCVEITGYPDVVVGWVRGGDGTIAPRVASSQEAAARAIDAGYEIDGVTYDAFGPQWQAMRDEAWHVSVFSEFSSGGKTLDWQAKSGPTTFKDTKSFLDVVKAISSWLASQRAPLT